MVCKKKGVDLTMPKVRSTVAVLIMDYTNWRGERSERAITPVGFEFTANQWHKERQWLLKAYDHRSNGFRTFAFTGIHGFRSDTIDKVVQLNVNKAPEAEH